MYMKEIKVGILSIIKNEHQYLDEWLQYHTRLVDKIYLFEDVGSLSHSDICSKYSNVILKSILSLYDNENVDKIIKDKKNHTAAAGFQISFMKQCLNYIKVNDTLDWVTYIDVDEFLTLENEEDSIQSIMKEYEEYKLVVLQWMNFNASGNIRATNLPVLESYHTRCKLFTGQSMSPIASSKIIFNMSTSNFVRCNHHIPFFKDGWCKTDFSRDLKTPIYKKLYIRHYITKSFEEYCKKIFLRGQFFGSKGLNHFFEFNPDISRNNKEVKEIIETYYNMFMNGDLNFYL